ncbi:MAG: undecaprenyl-diphosphate phosphatase [Candidatus Omnitrophica bacterium]|nr:undecaprenyl-diphosphate phosphatase [Candidatus Omnitrophota bacterium]
MTLLQAVILGFVQGLTEFFPISSSGHLVIIQGLFGIKEPMLAFDIFLHAGSLVAVLIYFRRDIWNLFTAQRMMLLYLAAASVPTAIIGLMLKDAVEELFTRPHITGYMFMITGVLLIGASLYTAFTRRRIQGRVGLANALITGTAQGLAIIPGISRSGATIASGIMSGIGREQAFRFSFLLSIPAIIGAIMIKAHNITDGLLSANMPCFLLGAVTAMLTGLFSVSVLLKVVKSNKLYFFGIYCIISASLIIVLL